jgi:hypothetical protein
MGRIRVAVFHPWHVCHNDRFWDVSPQDLHRNSRVSEPFRAVFFDHDFQEVFLRCSDLNRARFTNEVK